MVKNHVLTVIDHDYQVIYGQDSYYKCYFLKVIEDDDLVESYFVGKEILSKIYGKCILPSEMLHKMKVLGCERSEMINMYRIHNNQKNMEIKQVLTEMEAI